MQLNEEIAELVTRLKSEVELHGGVTVTGEELRILCPDNLSASDQFMNIATLAHDESWSFAFLPDGTVRFGSYLETQRA